MMQYRGVILAGVMGLASMSGQVRAEEAAATEPKKLESSIALGITVNDGNTDNNMGNAALTLDYRPCDKSSIHVGLDAAYGETEGDKTTENGKAVADYRYLLSERSFAAFNSSVAYDDIADLDYRWIVSPGVGYYFMKKDHVFLLGEFGPALIGEKKGGTESEENFALRFAQRYERKLESGAKFWQAAEYLPRVDDFDIYVVNAEIGVEAPLSQKLNIRLSAKDTYDSNPADGREYNDVTVIGALAYSLF